MLRTLHHYNLANLFDEVSAIYAAQPALCYEEEVYTYSELCNWIDALAALLLSKGLHRGDVIVIGNDKQALSYALMLASIRLGIVYVNIDVESPTERNNRILEVCRPKLLFYDNSRYEPKMRELAASQDYPLILLDRSILPIISEPDIQVQRKYSHLVDGSTIAYIMFTSGSTGIPKGVAVTHQNVLHLIAWGHNRFKITEQDNFANLSPMYFDNSVFDFYVGLFCGASISPIHRSLLVRPYDLVQYIDKRKCTVWFSVPSAFMYLNTMKALGLGQLNHLRAIIFGGEGYPKVELKKLYDRFSAQAMLVNVYGPTECTCICSGYTLSDHDFHDLEGLPPLGHLNPNFDYRILDEDNNDASEGELCLIGPNVAAGYFNDINRTEIAFKSILDENRYMKRMYCTGDLVREDGDGNLFFIGRKDNQIKHMGYRIELEEIEHALIKLHQIDQAAVIYFRNQSTYGKIISFVACSVETNEKIILESLSAVLPNYMMPAKVIIMPKLPTNANGKVDRQYLNKLID